MSFNYVWNLGLYPNELDPLLELVNAACDKYGIDFDEFCHQVRSDMSDCFIGNDITRTIADITLNKLRVLLTLDGHEVDAYFNGWDCGICVDGEDVYWDD